MRALNGKTALITNAGNSLGLEIALALSVQGANIVLSDTNFGECEQNANAVREVGGQALAMACHVKRSDDLRRAVDQTVRQFSRLDVLINITHDVSRPGLFSQSDESMNAGWQSGPLATFRMMKLVQPHMCQTGGDIINIVTSLSDATNEQHTPEAEILPLNPAMAAATSHFTRVAANVWQGDNIQAKCVLVGDENKVILPAESASDKNVQTFMAMFSPPPTLQDHKQFGQFITQLCLPDARRLNGKTLIISRAN